MSELDDRDLRARFAALRDADAAAAPSLAGILRRPAVERPARVLRYAPIAALAGAAVVTIVLVLVPRGTDPGADVAIAQARSISSWTAPTDAWLTLSGFEIPDTVPSLAPSSVSLPEAPTTGASGDAP